MAIEMKDYLGDGLYVEFDGWQLKLWADQPHGRQEVYLEPSVYLALTRFVERVKHAKQEEAKAIATEVQRKQRSADAEIQNESSTGQEEEST
jgi:hypothetical protein